MGLRMVGQRLDPWLRWAGFCRVRGVVVDTVALTGLAGPWRYRVLRQPSSHWRSCRRSARSESGAAAF
jgi:hypothetical protein